LDQPQTIIKPQPAFSFNAKELWDHRELIYFLTWRDIKVKYKQTALGILWVILQPLAMMLIFLALFSKSGFAKAVPGVAYPVFILSGLIVWNLFYASVSHAAESMLQNSGIIKKIYFPRLAIPISTVLGAVLDFFIAFLIFIVFCLVYDQTIHLNALVYFPLAFLLCIVFAFGLGTLTGALNMMYRDFRYLLPFLLQLLFFSSQIVYTLNMIEKDWIRYLLALNPMNAVIELFRVPLTGVSPDPNILLIGIVSGFIITLAGIFYFSKTQSYFADIA
jgi:lipopolysaccharide transport system permease protein